MDNGLIYIAPNVQHYLIPTSIRKKIMEMGSSYHYSILHFFLLLIIILSPANVSAAAKKERCNPEDKKVLLSIQKFYNNNYLLSSWSASTDCCTDWYIVDCDATTNRVTSLSMGTYSLPGTIAPAIGDLTYLKTLDFRKFPNITGPIPSSLAKLKHLEFLRLDYNSLTGPVPDFLHTLVNLSYINLSYNKLSGSIPPSIALGPTLDYLRLDRNSLTGPIPDSFGSIKNGEIFSLFLSHNHLSGPIPPSLGRLNVSYIFDLSRNNLTGDASFLFGKNKPVSQMDLSRNHLQFDFSKVVIPDQIQWLLLDHNAIYGSLPASLTEAQNLNNFNVSYNRLCGKIPAGGRLGQFDKYSFFHNKCLCGAPLDACN